MTNTQLSLALLVLFILAIGIFLVTGSAGDQTEYHCEYWWRCE